MRLHLNLNTNNKDIWLIPIHIIPVLGNRRPFETVYSSGLLTIYEFRLIPWDQNSFSDIRMIEVPNFLDKIKQIKCVQIYTLIFYQNLSSQYQKANK